MKTIYSFVFLLLVTGQTMLAQKNLDGIVRNYFQDNNTLAKSSLSELDVKEWKITDVVPSLNPEIQHVYVQQYYKNIPIQYGTYKLTIKGREKVTWEINQFVKSLKSKVTSSKSSFSPEQAIIKVVREHNLKVPQLNSVSKNSDNSLTFNGSGTTLEPIKVKQVYLEHEGELRLTWNVSIYPAHGQNWWNVNVDANSGEILRTEDWVIKCSFGSDSHESHSHQSTVSHEHVPTITNASSTALAPDSYNVFAMPVESPSHGSRSIVTNPANTVASPYGWHDTNGNAGAEHTITRGNNVWAQSDANGNNGTGPAPDGGTSLDFDFPINFNQEPASYIDASITNLFYWNNIMHDVWYQYGFNEASGNFQENNYGNGGIGGDSVNADAQDGSGINNANFSTPPDGGNARMQMFLWNRTNPGRDGDLDNGIIAHEYGHGISIRLVGGPSTNALGGSEQMGEGWSDWFGLMLTMKPGDVGTSGRGVGTYALGQSTGGTGIRPTAYSTDTAINGTTYSDINNLRVPHGVGYAFATILWDMTWALVDLKGFDSDFYNGTGGNNIAMALVIEGLKNTANNPGFVSGRDAILQADQDLYNGEYNCLIWTVFSARGVGKDAVENSNGGSNTNSDQVVSFVNGCDDGGGGGTDQCEGNITSFPYAESFEGSVGDWKQATTGDDLNWTVNSNGTPSNGTGPDSAVDGTSYIYVEASGNGTGYPNKRAILNSPCIDFSGVTTPKLEFQYHMIGSAIGTFTVEARTNNDGNWTSIFNVSGTQGSGWNTAEVDLSAYAGNSSVQLRLNTVTGSSWQGDVAIDALSINNGSVDPPPTCDAIDFNDFTITSFSNQDIAGDFSVVNGGAGLSMENNTWKYISLNYNVTENTVIEFDFSSTSQGEIHGVGFENDNTLTATRYFKVHGTQNYGVTNYDNYTSGTISYTIPVGTFYTGNMDRLVFINDNDGGSGNNSIFSNVKIYEGSCNGKIVAVTDFGETTPIIGNEDEERNTDITIAPNPVKKGSALQLSIKGVQDNDVPYTVVNILGQVVKQGKLNSNAIDASALESGLYILKIRDDIKRFVIE